ncbi:MAG TPA: hypothetical protein VIH57_03320 [Bacteroidales bacterium]
MLNLRLNMILIVLISFYSCKKEKEYNFNPSGNYVNAEQNGGFYIDKVNDTEKSFIDLNNLSVNITDIKINISIGLLNIPDSVTFSQTALYMNALNYEWSIYFDLDNSDSLSTGDISISIMSFKSTNNQYVTKGILSGTQQDIWLCDADGYLNIASLKDYVSIKGNVINFFIPKSINPVLKSIDKGTKFYFKAYCNDGFNVCTDYYPDRT